MFKIIPATGTDINWARDYLGYNSNGMIMILSEEDIKTGAVCFDIKDSTGILEKIKVDNPEMKTVTTKAAMNFLELNNIYNLYIEKDEFLKDEEFYRSLGFENKNGQAYINLEGYFDAKHEKGC